MKPLPAEDKYVGVYLLDLVKKVRYLMFSICHGVKINAYHNFYEYNICNSLFCLSIFEGVKRTLQCMPNKKSTITLRRLLSMYNYFKGEVESQ